MVEKTMRRFLILALLAIGCPTVAIGSPVRPPAPAPQATELKTIHVLVAFDTDSDLVDSLKIDLSRIKWLLADSIPPSRYEFKELTGSHLTRANLLAYYNDPALKVGPDVGLVFFYGGHGAVDPKHGHYLRFKHGPEILRSELRQAMEARRPGLAVLLTDCCSTPRKIERVPEVTAPAGAPADNTHIITFRPVVRNLFFQARGTVDITAATDGTSWGDDLAGGIFTRTFCSILTRKVADLDRDRDGIVTWKKVFPIVQSETATTFRTWSATMRKRGEVIPATTQKPYAFSLGAAPTPVSTAPVEGSRYAVVSFENRTGADLTFEYRWPGQTEWKSASLATNGKQAVYTPIDGPLGDAFALEVRLGGRPGIARLVPRIWKGTGKPSFDDGEITTITRRGK
jgi:Caspase domain